MTKNPLLDQFFLKKLYKQKNKVVYAKIVSLNSYEEPIEEITGIATGGSVNIDGNSAVRRTCSLTLVANDISLTDYYWGLKTKFKLFVGLENTVDDSYPDMIWFPQGTYIITSFNTSQGINTFTVNISGKDKMCLLNGEISGAIHANSTRFDIITTYDSELNSSTDTKLTLREIIQEAVHEYAGEPFYNIVINDLDDDALELLQYKGEDTLYILINKDSLNADNIYVGKPEGLGDDFKFYPLTIEGGFANIDYENLSQLNGSYVAKVEYGQTAGYWLTDLTYAGELTVSTGETITGVLDKIKTMLGDYEYFYDVNGQFVFQKKKTYINTSWNNLNKQNDNEIFADAAAYQSPIVWSFEGNDMLTQISNNPSINNIKNDFSIWGTKKALSGAEIPIHYRYAIDKKPTFFKNYDGETFSISELDYRELIYQMALDFRKNHTKEDYVPTLMKNNPEMCVRGRTGYEQYYIDMEGFWRQLYKGNDNAETLDKKGYNIENYNENTYWNKDVAENPAGLNFWFELLDTDGEISKFSVAAIGDRSKTVNDSKIKAIYYQDTPLIIYYESNEDNKLKPEDIRYSKPGYAYVQFGNLQNLFSISTQGKTAKSELDSLLYEFTCCTENVTLSSIPIYTLNPNTLISVKDDQNMNVNGKYVVSKVSIPLTYNSLMSVSASKLPQKII